ncbi:TniQ family protein [Tardiphaga sp. 862_B3_N1_1]|uniref:TniQ family protein n=1 Tax=Tardiphaga sp. 862_B3_N1_1 TaxID=3240763 RepID=UPI003F8A6891
MPAKLTLRVPLMPDELATDYCSRLALRNFRSASAFALDMGFHFSDITSKSDTAIAKLAEISGEPFPLLDENRLRWMTIDRGRLKGQVMARQTLRHKHYFGCPACFKQDIETSALPPTAAVRHRMHWMLASVQTCEKHHIALQKLGNRIVGNIKRNWSEIADTTVRNLPALAEAAVPMSPTDFEVYLIKRLYEAPTESWLDRLEFFAAEHTARVFGVAANPDIKASLDELSDHELREVGQAGFEIVNGGADSISRFLLDLQRNYRRDATKRRARDVTPAMVYGRIYASLKRLEKNLAYRPVQLIVAEHALANFPLGPGDNVFGVRLEERRLHSLSTAARQFSMGPSRILKIFTAGGLLPLPGWDDDVAVVDATEAERLIGLQMESITQVEAQSHLNVSANVMNSLIDCNLIARHKQSTGLHAHRFLVSELDTLLATVLSGAHPVATGTDGVLSLGRAAQTVQSSVHAITAMIIDRRLKWVGYRTDLRGFASIVVDPTEVASVLQQSHTLKLSTTATASRLSLSPSAVRHLVGKLLVATPMKHPVTHQIRLFFDETDLDRFDAEYVSLSNLSRLMNRHVRSLKMELAKRSILPVLEESRVMTIYRRADLDL